MNIFQLSRNHTISRNHTNNTNTEFFMYYLCVRVFYDKTHTDTIFIVVTYSQNIA